MSMKKLCYCFVVMALSIAGCTDDQLGNNAPNQDFFGEERQDELKNIFGRGVAKAFAESMPFRQLIKGEALEMFDRDYDVLYHAIKDENLDDEGTVRDLLRNYISEEDLSEIERTIPLLTLFVPELPENTFSASLWNVKEQVPVVGVTSYKTNDVAIVNSEGESYILPSHVAPGFPVVVVKECERVTATEAGRQTANGRVMTAGDISFQFLGDCFDGSLKIKDSGQGLGGTQSSSNGKSFALGTQHLKATVAYQVFPGSADWQRDYIYYNLTPQSTKGAFIPDYVEHLYSFRLAGDPTSVYNRIADQTMGTHIDPKFTTRSWIPFVDGPLPAVNVGWTGGNFEFRVTVTMTTNSGVGNRFITYFHATPLELFNTQWVLSSNSISYNLRIVGLKDKFPNLQLFPWDLKKFGDVIVVEIEEVDQEMSVTKSSSVSTKSATNFGFDAGLGKEVKIGLKFGTSTSTTKTSSQSWTEQHDSDKLGTVTIHFGQRIITGHSTQGSLTYFTVPEYGTGFYAITLIPALRQ